MLLYVTTNVYIQVYIHVWICADVCIFVYTREHICRFTYTYTYIYKCMYTKYNVIYRYVYISYWATPLGFHFRRNNPQIYPADEREGYGVATINRLLKIVGLFCKRAL